MPESASARRRYPYFKDGRHQLPRHEEPGPIIDRWAVPWHAHRADIDTCYDHPGRRFLLRAMVTCENAEHLRAMIDCMAGTLALSLPDNPFSWAVLENTWGTPDEVEEQGLAKPAHHNLLEQEE